MGEHAFWHGSLRGRTVALQGDSSFTKYDLFEVASSQRLYWGTFRGNGYRSRAVGGDFDDAQALATSTQVWEWVVAEATVGPTTTAIKVRGVRDGANQGNAYFDAITLQRVD